MLRISKLADYALLITNSLATKPDQWLSAQELARLTPLNLPTVSKVLKRLLEAGLLRSSRGTLGGYQLVKPPEAISIVAIIAAIDGNPALIECGQLASRCQHETCCTLKHNWQMINHAIIGMLDSVTLADIGQPLDNHPIMNVLETLND